MRVMIARSSPDFGIVFREEEVRPRLRARVAKPFCWNIAGHDVGRSVGRVLRKPPGVEQRRTEHILQTSVRIAIVGCCLLDRPQLERETSERQNYRCARTQQREHHLYTKITAHLCGPASMCVQGRQLPIAS
jgi:hypothetical protein